MEIFYSRRASLKKLAIALVFIHACTCILFTLSNSTYEDFDETQVHRMFQPALDSVNEKYIKEALIAAEENVLKELRREQAATGNPPDVILPAEKRFILILSFWRSGSTFLYEMITAFPASYGYFEPLSPILGDNYDPLQQRSGSLKVKLKSIIRNNFVCNIENGKSSFFEFLEMDYLNLDNKVNEVCKTPSLTSNSTSCYDPRLHKGMCQSMPVVVQKIVRLESSFIPDLLQIEDLNFKIVVLMRDPRAVMLSRKNVEFCFHSPICSNVSLMCAEMERTFDIVTKYQSAYRDRLYFLRYEDLVGNLEEASKNLFAFLDLPVTDSVLQYLHSHTNLSPMDTNKEDDAFSTYRNTRQALTRWRKINSFAKVKKMQLICSNVIRKLNYKVFDDVLQFKNTRISNVL